MKRFILALAFLFFLPLALKAGEPDLPFVDRVVEDVTGQPPQIVQQVVANTPASSSAINLGVSDLLVDMNGNSVGTQATAAVLNTGTVSPGLGSFGGWFVGGTGSPADLTVGAAQPNCNITSNQYEYIYTTKYTSTHSEQSLAINNEAAEYTQAYLYLPFESEGTSWGLPVVNVFGCLAENVSNGSGLFDRVITWNVNGSFDAVLQTAAPGGGYAFRLETDPGGSAGSIVFANSSGPGVYYYYLQDNASSGYATACVWEFVSVSWSLLGCGTRQEQGIPISYITFGNNESGTDNSTTFFQNTQVSFSNVGLTTCTSSCSPNNSPITGFAQSIWQMQSLYNSTGSGTTTTVTPLAPLGPLNGGNDCLSADAAWGNNSYTASVGDSINGSWTAIGSPVTQPSASTTLQLFFKCGISATTPTVTLTTSGSTNAFLDVHEFYGTPGTLSGVLDKSPSAGSGTSTSIASGTSGTTTKANEYIFTGCFSASPWESMTPPWIPDYYMGNGTYGGSPFLIVSAEGAYQLTATQTSSAGYACQLATIK